MLSAVFTVPWIRFADENVTFSACGFEEASVETEKSKCSLYSVQGIYTQTVEPKEVLHWQTKEEKLLEPGVQMPYFGTMDTISA